MTTKIAGSIVLAYLRAWEQLVGPEALAQQIAKALETQQIDREQQTRIQQLFQAVSAGNLSNNQPSVPRQLLALPFHGYLLSNPQHSNEQIHAQTLMVGKLWWQGSPPIARPAFTGLRSLFEPQINELMLATSNKYYYELGAELIELCFARLLGSQSGLGYQCQVLGNEKAYDNQYVVSVEQCPACWGQHEQCAVTQGLISAAWEWFGWDSYKLQMDSRRKIELLHPHALQLK